jgi:hypothetical protein
MAQPRRGAVGNKGKRQQEHRCRMPPQRFARNEPVRACVWKKRIDLVCAKDCTCDNSIPRQAEERVSQVRGMDVAADSWGVVANRDIRKGTLSQSSAVLPISKRLAAKAQSLVSCMRGYRRKASRSSTHSMATLQSPATYERGEPLF